MLAIEFEGSRWIGKPPSMTDEECSGIYANSGPLPTPGEKGQWFLDALAEISPSMPQTEEEYYETLKAFFNAALSKIKPVQFQGIPAYEDEDSLGFHYWATYWRPNREDLEALKNGGGLIVKSLSDFLVPMALIVLKENGELA